jgi:hypothetical protein
MVTLAEYVRNNLALIFPKCRRLIIYVMPEQMLIYLQYRLSLIPYLPSLYSLIPATPKYPIKIKITSNGLTDRPLIHPLKIALQDLTQAQILLRQVPPLPLAQIHVPPPPRSYTIDFYNKPIPRDTRTCSFGYGNKFFFDKVPNNPSSSTYHLPHERKIGISFGTGRDVRITPCRKSSRETTSTSPSKTQYRLPHSDQDRLHLQPQYQFHQQVPLKPQVLHGAQKLPRHLHQTQPQPLGLEIRHQHIARWTSHHLQFQVDQEGSLRQIGTIHAVPRYLPR